jgi:hypothetical protein
MRGLAIGRRKQTAQPYRWQPTLRATSAHYSKSEARFFKDDLVPISLSSGRMPAGMSSQRTVISVPSSVSAKLVVIFISPANLGASDSNSTTSTIFSQFKKSAVEGISVARGLATRQMLWVLVGERHAKSAAFARVDGVHVTFHVIRRPPSCHSVRVEAGLIYRLARRLDDL